MAQTGPGGEWGGKPAGGRRAEDQQAGERMTRMENRLENIGLKQDEQTKALTRVHERIDDMASQFQVLAAELHSKVFDVIQKVETRESNVIDFCKEILSDHVREEEKLKATEDRMIVAQFEAVTQALMRVEASGKDRLAATTEGLAELKGMGTKVIWALIGTSGFLITFFGGLLIKNWDFFAHVVSKLEALK